MDQQEITPNGSMLIRPYRYEDLNDAEFEELSNSICTQLLGLGTISFSAGPDGGRDGKFTGKANEWPSATEPASGHFIIQAKWTSNPAASVSDSDFKKVVDKEIPKIETLVENGELDHYLLFTNRKKPANSTQLVIDRIIAAGVKSVGIFGIEELNRHLQSNPTIWSNLGFPETSRPFHVDPTDLNDLVSSFRDAVENGGDQFDSARNFTYLKQAEKNKINGVSADYATYMRESSLPHFADIQTFLQDPRNAEVKSIYHDAADDLKQKILVFRDQFDSFDKVLTYIHDLVTNANDALRTRKRFVRVFLHYMYHDCDIGQHA